MERSLNERTNLFNSFQSRRGHFDLQEGLKRVGEEALSLHVRKPCPSGLFQGEGDIVSVLLGFVLVETQLGAFERLRRKCWRHERKMQSALTCD